MGGYAEENETCDCLEAASATAEAVGILHFIQIKKFSEIKVLLNHGSKRRPLTEFSPLSLLRIGSIGAELCHQPFKFLKF